MNHHPLIYQTYIVFTDSNRWPFKWFKRGFQHVQVFKPYANVWIQINPQLSHIDVQLYPIERPIPDIVGDCTIVEYCTNVNPVHINSSLGYTTCIDEVKRLIGIRGFTPTPYSLYRRLQHGADEKAQKSP